MKDLASKLKKCSLFKHLNEQEIITILSLIDYKIIDYNKDDYIAFEEDSLSNIGIIIDGNVGIQKIYPSAKTITISTMTIGDTFGEVIVFSDTKFYPANIISSNNSKILFISKSNILKLCNINTTFLENLMSMVSNIILLLNKKLAFLSHKTIREKIAS